MDCTAVVLSKLLETKNLEIWSRIKLAFIDSAYSSVYSAISRYYEKYNEIPSFEELEINMREGAGKSTLAALKLIECDDISADVAVDALIDQYTQTQAVNLLDKFVDKLPVYDTDEIKQELHAIVMELDEKTHSNDGVFFMSDILLFRTEEELTKNRVHIGLNNNFDALLGGVARQELILIGGRRGAGKSITSSNLIVNQYEAGKSAVLFTIEMAAHEVLERNLSIISNVPNVGLKKNTLTEDELFRVIKARAEMFEDSDDLVKKYLQHRDRFRFETELIKTKSLKRDNQMVIIDDRKLTLSAIDLHLSKLKTKFGDNLSVCVVDYLNQIVPERTNASQYDWQPQIDISKGLKNLARKYDVVMVSPYQVDASGEARFAKGILDAPDIALLMQTHEKEAKAVSFTTTKIRGGPNIEFCSPINWDTLRISSMPIDKPGAAPAEEKQSKKIARATETKEYKTDIPWN